MTQNERIANYLRSGKTLTKPVALRQFGSWRLGARIFDLRHNNGMNIATIRNSKGDIAYMYMGKKTASRKSR